MPGLKIKHNRHFGSHFRSHNGGKTTTPSGVAHTTSEKLLHDCIFSFRRKHLNDTFTREEREDNWPERSVHVSPDKLGSDPLHSQGAHTAPARPLAPTASREMWKSRFVISESFFYSPCAPESPAMKGRLCSCSAHTPAVCQSESVIRGVFVKEIFRYLWVLRGSLLTSVYVDVCVCRVKETAVFTEATSSRRSVDSALWILEEILCMFSQ